MAWRLFSRHFIIAANKFKNSRLPCFSQVATLQHSHSLIAPDKPMFQWSRFYASGRRNYHLFGGKVPADVKEFRREWAKELEEEEDHLWTGSEGESDTERDPQSHLMKEIKKAKLRAKRGSNSDEIDADDSDEFHSMFSDSDEEEKTLWTGDEGDDEDDVPPDPIPNERSDRHIDKLFEFNDTPRVRSFADAFNYEEEKEKKEDFSPGKQARKIAMQNALKKLKRGPDGRYTNVWEVMSDIDVLIGAFENIVSGPEYEELRLGGPKRLNMDYFKDIQARMRDPNFRWSQPVKLKPKSKFLKRDKWQKAERRRRKDQRR